MLTTADALIDRRGDEELVLHDATLKKHKDYQGAWMDMAKGSTTDYYHIIIEKPDPKNTTGAMILISCKALKSNIEVYEGTRPKTYTEAAFAQITQLQATLDEFALVCAKCRVKKSWELSSIIGKALDRAECKQLSKGHHAQYYLVDESVLPPPEVSNVEDDEGHAWVWKALQ